jgi:hypothetical protein
MLYGIVGIAVSSRCGATRDADALGSLDDWKIG